MKNSVNHIVFYGTLCDINIRKALKINDSLEFVSICSVSGSLYNLGEYPGLVLGKNSIITAQLYLIKKTSCIPILDEYEEYNPNNLKNSLYLRKMIELPEFDCFAWIYEYNQKVMENQLI
jgi:gamma-glutamylcyclotransferase (GGCT)/AIG2-like uncharacterized protein YtfP